MAKVFGFTGFGASKVFGSREGGEKIILVKGVATKAEAKEIAQKNMPSLRVFAGRTYKNEEEAVECAKRTTELGNKWGGEHRATNPATWSIVDAGLQRSLAKLVGM